jgi:predicted dehydrogenase
VFVGYDHVVGQAAQKLAELISDGAIGDVLTLDVEFREHWGGIFKAHPWLTGPSDSYLGYWRRGGGASGEHSHALNLWQFLARHIGAGRVTEVDAMLRYVKDGAADYDSLCCLNLTTESGFAGRVVQDVVTHPVRKVAVVQGTGGTLQWVNGYEAGVDAVLYASSTKEEVWRFPKTRPDDFIAELRHIQAVTAGALQTSPISLESGLDTMLVIAAAHLSEQEKQRVSIDYGAGYRPSALVPACVQVEGRR